MNQPFLYPPYTLPPLAVLATLPRQVVLWSVVLVCLLISIACCRRLSMPWLWIPFVLLWPPFAEGIVAGNIGIPIFGAFVFLFYRSRGRPWRPEPRDIGEASPYAGSDPMVAGLAAFQGAIKVSQPHSWLFTLRHRRRAAIIGAVGLVAFAAATVAITGLGVWFDWLGQVQLASDPSWDLGGIAVPRFLPPGMGLLVVIVCVVAVWFVPRRDPGPPLGVLSVVGSLSLHTFGLLFLVPAMLVIRRELALIAACFVATYSYEGTWAGILVVTLSLAASLFGNDRVSLWVAENPRNVPVRA